MFTPVIKKAAPADAEALSLLARKTFSEAFSPTNSEENMRLYMDANFYPEKQREEILDPKRMIYIAWHNDTAIGFLNLFDGTPESCVKSRPTLELSRIYIDSKWHGTGLAREFVELAFTLAKKNECASLWLGVWENNIRAQKFYYKMGFEKVGTHIFMMGNDPQNDLILECFLK